MNRTKIEFELIKLYLLKQSILDRIDLLENKLIELSYEDD